MALSLLNSIHLKRKGGRPGLLGMGIKDQSVSAEKRHYYSSSQEPFHNANNILMFFGGGGRAEIVETIIRSLRMGDSVITISGEPGSGKTMLSLVLADRLKHRHNIIRYDLPQMSSALMLRHLLIEICPRKVELISAEQASGGASDVLIKQGIDCLITALSGASPGDKPYLLTVDSQADLDPQTLQLLNELVQSQDKQNPRIQVVLFRRTDQSDQLQRMSKSLIGFNANCVREDHYALRRLTFNEISEYLRHHMMLFDFNQRDVFTRDMAYFIADRSDGIFRSINTLSRNAFMVAALEDAEQVTMSHLLSAGLPPTKPEPAPHGFFWHHRRAVVLTIGVTVLAGLSALVAYLT